MSTVGYTQGQLGFWYKTSNQSGPYAYGDDGAMYLIGGAGGGEVEGTVAQGADGTNINPVIIGGLHPDDNTVQQLVLTQPVDGAVLLLPTAGVSMMFSSTGGVFCADAPQVINYNGDGTINYIQITNFDATVYRQTWTWVAGNPTAISAWVQQ